MDFLIGYVIQKPTFLLMNILTIMPFYFLLLLGVVSVLVGGARLAITWAAPQVFLQHYSIAFIQEVS